jgi:hypothetical protein
VLYISLVAGIVVLTPVTLKSEGISSSEMAVGYTRYILENCTLPYFFGCFPEIYGGVQCGKT